MNTTLTNIGTTTSTSFTLLYYSGHGARVIRTRIRLVPLLRSHIRNAIPPEGECT
jgi:hypothetical protein